MRIAKTCLAVCFMLFLSACSNKNKVNLLETTAKDEVPSLGNLTFTFDKNLAPDSVLNRWDTTAFVEFSPPIPGRFRWENANELVFSPESDLPPSTTFKADITSLILKYEKKLSMGKCETTHFHTPYLQLQTANAMWNVSDGNASSAFPQIDMYFNYRVNPTKLKELLTIEVDGVKKEFNLQTTTTDNKISVSLSGMKMDDKDLACHVKIAKGLMPEGGTNATDKDLEANLTITSPFTLTIQNVDADHDGTQGTIKVNTSQQPLPDELKNFITIDPKVNFKTEVTAEGFLITSEDFDLAKTYTLTLKKGLKGRIGGTLKEDYANTLGFGQLEPKISIVNKKGIYLTSKGSKNIEVAITSVKKVKIIISKIYENNLLAAQHNGYEPSDNSGDYEGGRYYYEEGGDNGNSFTNSDGVMGDIIYEKEIDTKSLPRYGNNRLFKFNLEDKLKDFKGIYHISIRSSEQYYLRDSRFISLSDIGLIAKQGTDKITVFANSIQTAEALSGVAVTVYGRNNQAIGTSTTDGNGVAEISLSKKDYTGFTSAMITARNGNDFNYLPFNNTRVETSRFDVGGKRSNPTNLDAFVYSERDIYRPGEKINFSVIVRDWAWKNPGEIPLKLKFLLPNGKELKTLKKTLNDAGSLETQIELSASAITGSYSLEVYTSNDILLTTKNVQIEEFMPDRIKVASDLDKKFLKPGETTTLNINATNFFGPPASDRNYQVEIQLKEKYFYPQKYYGYNFSLADRTDSYEKIEREGKTDDKGNAKETYTAPADYSNRGIIQTDFYTTVFDETGRPVNRRASIDIYTQDVFYGIKDDGYYYYALNQPITFPLIALNKDERPLENVKTHIQVIKHDYRTVLSRNYSYFRYESQREDKTIIDQDITVSGENTVFKFTPKTPGEYEIRVAKPGVNSYVRNQFYSYGWWGNYGGGNFEVNNEGNVDISLDKKTYMAGETAKVLFKTPFNGKLLVTVENDKVIQYQYVKVENRAASVNLNLSAEYLPNAYISATLIKPNEQSDMPLTVAHGYKSISVTEKGRNMDVQIFAEKEVRSRTHQKVRIKTAPDSKVTMAVVDEGILQITNYKTPDPYNFFYANRALGVTSFDLYPLLFPEIKGMLSSTGGDAAMNKRTNPMQNKRVKLVSYWSGIMDANGNGEASFEFDIPQFSGQLRLMAVAYQGQSFGSKDAEMIVADPIVLSSALPRFLSPKDTVIMPVTITNTTKNATSATASIRLTGPLKIVGNSTQTVSVNAKSEQRVQFKIVADPKINIGKVTVEVSALGEKFKDETDITIRPPASLQKITGSGPITAGASQKIDFNTGKFIPSSIDYQLIVSKNPALEVADQMWYLIRYPFGCTEQTVSAAFPQLYFSDLSEMMNMNKSVKLSANYNVQEAIRKIKMRQLYNGAITLWDYEGSENWWATVYAAHFLQEAKKAGFDVDQSLLDNIYSYLINRLKNKETITYYYNRNMKKQIAPKEIAYSLYVLAEAGKPQVSTMNYYKENPDMLALDSKYLLSAAYAIAGDKAKFRELLPNSFNGEISDRETGGSFYSEIRDEGVALNAILDADPQNAQIGIMAKHLSQQIKSSYWLSTQERAFAFLALGKIARQANQTNIKASILVNGKEVAQNDGSTLKLTAKQLGGTNVEIRTSGTGRLYYFWQAEGISNDGSFKEEDSYLRVRKRFYDRYGRQISGNTFAQNDLVIVAITLENSYNRYIENVVITDMLPAGFEIENPRTKEIPGMDWIKNESSPTQLDVRDDRINLFVNMGTQPQTYYYAVRAVSPGTYVMGPVMADAMYNGEYHSYNGGGCIKIVQK